MSKYKDMIDIFAKDYERVTVNWDDHIYTDYAPDGKNDGFNVMLSKHGRVVARNTQAIGWNESKGLRRASKKNYKVNWEMSRVLLITK